MPPDRAYGSFEELIEKERALPADRRIDFISIATPNYTHFPIAKQAVEAGFNVICDKPMTFNLYEAEDLAATVEKSGVVFALTHNYTGYPLMREARQMILSGELGRDSGHPLELFAGLAAVAHRDLGPEAGVVADRSDEVGSGRFVRRLGHARLQPGPLFDGADSGRSLLHLKGLCAGPATR